MGFMNVFSDVYLLSYSSQRFEVAQVLKVRCFIVGYKNLEKVMILDLDVL